MLKTPAHYRPGLDLVRLAALLPVLCYHFCIEAARSGFAVPAALIGRGMADWVEGGLAWFFLLSGAALCLQWQGRFAWRPYLAGRAAAMYPAFWLGFAVLFLYGEVLHGNNPDVPRWRVVFSVLGLDGYLAPLTATFYKIGEWFLGVILLLYLVFPLLLWCMDARARRRGLLAVMLVLQLAWPVVCPAPLEAGHTVLGRLPAFALGAWFGMRLRAGGGFAPRRVPRRGGLRKNAPPTLDKMPALCILVGGHKNRGAGGHPRLRSKRTAASGHLEPDPDNAGVGSLTHKKSYCVCACVFAGAFSCFYVLYLFGRTDP